MPRKEWEKSIGDTARKYGHLVRKNNKCKTKQIPEARPEGRRRRVRPRKEWEQYIGETARNRGIS